MKIKLQLLQNIIATSLTHTSPLFLYSTQSITKEKYLESITTPFHWSALVYLIIPRSMESNLDNCFYFTVFKDHRPSMAITNWLSEASSFPVPEEQAICLPPFLYVSLCASFECWWRIWGNPLDTATAQFNTQETTGSKNAKQTKLPYPKYSSSFLKISIIIIEFNKTVWRNDPGCLLCFIRSGW